MRITDIIMMLQGKIIMFIKSNSSQYRPSPNKLFFREVDKMRVSKSDRSAQEVVKRKRKAKSRQRVEEIERTTPSKGPTWC